MQAHEWAHFLCAEPAHRSNTSVCLTLDLPADSVAQLLKLLDTEGARTTTRTDARQRLPSSVRVTRIPTQFAAAPCSRAALRASAR